MKRQYTIEVTRNSRWYRNRLNDVGRTMLCSYIQAALRHAKHDILLDDKSYYGEIPGFQGVYANAKTLEAYQEQLGDVLEEWILFRVSTHLPLPVVDGIELKIREIVYLM